MLPSPWPRKGSHMGTQCSLTRWSAEEWPIRSTCMKKWIKFAQGSPQFKGCLAFCPASSHDSDFVLLFLQRKPREPHAKLKETPQANLWLMAVWKGNCQSVNCKNCISFGCWSVVYKIVHNMDISINFNLNYLELWSFGRMLLHLQNLTFG